MRIGASEVILLGCMACWSACSAILTTQIADLANPDHRCAALQFWVLDTVCPFVLLLMAFEIKQRGDEEEEDAADVFVSPKAHPRSSVTITVTMTTLRVARFALMVSPFFFLLRPQPQALDADASVILALMALLLEGISLICLFTFCPAGCYGLLLCLITGVICTSASRVLALHPHRPYQHYYTACLVLVSLLLMFLCDLYLSLQTLPPPTNSKTQAAADESTMV